MNKVILIGRLTKDPVVRYTPAGQMPASSPDVSFIHFQVSAIILLRV